MKTYLPTKAKNTDKKAIFELYKKVSQNRGGLARGLDEITETYIETFSNKAQQDGVQLVVRHTSESDKIIAEIHCCKLEPKVFSHILSKLTVAVDPDCQGQGLGTLIFKALLELVNAERNDILRVELIARASNIKAINLYQQLGFIIEGRLERRIKTEQNLLEADIPMAWFNKNYQR